MACSDRPPQAASPRDGLAELERSRQQVQLLTSREAELQQEVTRLQAENRRLTRSREALMLELDPAGLAEENRNLLQEKKQMLLELQRVARDNQRLAQSEALARAELEAFVCPSFWTRAIARAGQGATLPPNTAGSVLSVRIPELDGQGGCAFAALGAASASSDEPKTQPEDAAENTAAEKPCVTLAPQAQDAAAAASRGNGSVSRLMSKSPASSGSKDPSPSPRTEARGKPKSSLSPRPRPAAGQVSKSPQLEEARNLLSNLRGEAQKDGPRRSACEAPKRVQFGAKADPPNFRELPAVKVDAELAADEVDPSSSCSTAPSLTVQEDGSSPAKNGFPFAAACEAKEEASESGSTGSASGYVFLESGVFIDRSSPDSGESSESGESEHSKGEPPAKAQRKLSKLKRQQSLSDGDAANNELEPTLSETTKLSHRRCRSCPTGHSEAKRKPEPAPQAVQERPRRGSRPGRGRILTESLPPEYFKSRGGRDGALGTLSLFLPQQLTPRQKRRLSSPLTTFIPEDNTGESLQEVRESIFEAFFVIDVQETQQESRPRAKTEVGARNPHHRRTRLASLVPGVEKNHSRMCWPDGVQGGPLEQMLVERGFCPGPMDYRFNGNAFVLSVLAQALNPTAHPNDLAYCTVVSEDDHIPALPADHRELLEDEPEVNHCRAHKEDSDDMLQHIPDGGVLCLVSKLPFFDFSFALLDILRQNLEQAPALLERINEKGMAQLARGLEVGDLIDKPRVLGLTTMSQRMPEPLLSPGCEWSHFANLSHPESSSPLALTLARWQVWWGLMTLLMRWGDKLLEVVIKLLPCVVLEQQVLLLGDAPRACVVALLLRGMLWPFQWQHPFICAPLPPAALHELPLLEACCPMIMAFGEMPMLAHFWRYDTVYQLPPNIVVGLLRNEWVYINEKLETTGGLSGTNTSKFPPFVQTDLRNKIKEARKRLRNRQNGQEFLDAVQQVQDAVTEAIGKLAGLVKSYAKSRVAEEQHGGAMSENQAEELRERSYQRALKVDEFLAWLRGEAATYGEPEPVEFYKTFLQTQCFMNLLFEEICAEVDTRMSVRQ